jgi:hypothetical protein
MCGKILKGISRGFNRRFRRLKCPQSAILAGEKNAVQLQLVSDMLMAVFMFFTSSIKFSLCIFT